MAGARSREEVWRLIPFFLFYLFLSELQMRYQLSQPGRLGTNSEGPPRSCQQAATCLISIESYVCYQLVPYSA